MKKRRVLVTAVGGNIGQGVIKALRASSVDFEISGIDMQPLAAGFSFTDRYFTVPKTSAAAFPAAFAKILKQAKIEAVYACSPGELAFFSRHKRDFERKQRVKIFVNTPFVVETGSDKSLTAKFLKENNFPYLQTVYSNNKPALLSFLKAAKYPVLLKPRIGATSKNVFLAQDKKEALALTAAISDLIIQEYADGEEYTASTLSDRGAKARALIILKRDLNQGTTYRTELYRNAGIEKQILRMADALASEGPCNFQFRIVKGKPYVFEINPRFSGTVGIRHLYGFNDADMIFRYELLNQPIRQPKLKKAVTLRYWNEVVLENSSFSALKKPGSIQKAKQVCLP